MSFILLLYDSSGCGIYGEHGRTGPRFSSGILALPVLRTHLRTGTVSVSETLYSVLNAILHLEWPRSAFANKGQAAMRIKSAVHNVPSILECLLCILIYRPCCHTWPLGCLR